MHACCGLNMLLKTEYAIGAAMSASRDVAERSGSDRCWLLVWTSQKGAEVGLSLDHHANSSS